MNVFFLKKYRRYTVMYPSQRQFASYFGNYSIKHYLARSCFQLWPKIGDEGDKILREKNILHCRAIVKIKELTAFVSPLFSNNGDQIIC